MSKFLPIVLALACCIQAKAQPSDYTWVRAQTGSGGTQLVKDVVLGHDQYVYAWGEFSSGSLVLGGSSLTNGGGKDIFLAKYDTLGNLQWARRYGSGGNDTAVAITADSLGNVYATGACGAAASFGGLILATGHFILKLTAAGTEAWVSLAASHVANADIASDPVGNTVICGYFSGTAQVGTAMLTATSTAGDGYVAQFSSNGNFNWHKQFYAASFNACEAVTVASDGRIGIGGQTYSSTKIYVGNGSTIDSIACNYTPNFLYSRIGSAAFVCSLAANGSFLWGKENLFVNEYKTYAYVSSACADPNGDFYFAVVRNENGLSFGSYQSTLQKFSTAGTRLWTSNISGKWFDFPLYGSRYLTPSMAVAKNRIVVADRKDIMNPITYFTTVNYFLTCYYGNGDTVWVSAPSPSLKANGLCMADKAVFAGGERNGSEGFLAGMPNGNSAVVAPMVINTPPTDKSVCLGSAIALAPGMNVHGGVYPYTYQWLPAIGLSDATVANPLAGAGPVGITDYILTVTDALGNYKKDTVKLTVNAAPALGADTLVYHLCANETSNLPLLYNTGGLSVVWNTPTPTAAPPGQYRLIATNAAGCKDTALVTVVLDVATWTGAVSSDWHTPNNWSTHTVPTAITHVIINSGTPNNCLIGTANAVAASLQLRNGAVLSNANGMSLVVTGTCAVLPN